MKKVYKYGTGQEIPKDAIYLSTQLQTQVEIPGMGWGKCWLVWHYFLVETEE